MIYLPTTTVLTKIPRNDKFVEIERNKGKFAMLTHERMGELLDQFKLNLSELVDKISNENCIVYKGVCDDGGCKSTGSGKEGMLAEAGLCPEEPSQEEPDDGGCES